MQQPAEMGGEVPGAVSFRKRGERGMLKGFGVQGRSSRLRLSNFGGPLGPRDLPSRKRPLPSRKRPISASPPLNPEP